MKKLMKKLRMSRGETLVESMCAILIFTLASVLFLNMISGASKINRTVDRENEEVWTALSLAEQVPESGDTVQAEISLNGGVLMEKSVVRAGNGTLTAYYPASEEG